MFYKYSKINKLKTFIKMIKLHKETQGIMTKFTVGVDIRFEFAYM